MEWVIQKTKAKGSLLEKVLEINGDENLSKS